MTTKEKAQELVEKFLPHMYCYMGSGMLSNDYDLKVATDNAKKCALFVVDEILQEINHGKKLDWIKERKSGQEYIVYWATVKADIQEIKQSNFVQ
jgi:hypothetical protein